MRHANVVTNAEELSACPRHPGVGWLTSSSCASSRKARHADGSLSTGYISHCTVVPSSLGVRLAQDYIESGYIFTLLDALHEVAVQQ